MRKILMVLLTTSFFTFLAQRSFSQPLSTVVKIQAIDMARAVLAKDVNKLAAYLPPKLVAEAGGKERLLVMRDTLNKFMNNLAQK